MTFILVFGGVRVHYVTVGEGPPVVLLHGAAGACGATPATSTACIDSGVCSSTLGHTGVLLASGRVLPPAFGVVGEGFA
jgi:pimeloyl-ACP methyl ester carboxylesterase